ncbi:hypothetical protein SBA4_3530005 [Candidatus Sulfopaludibacter sp. SbA4]|nr:hypothetical protein SBA4_3530005 [Candidatus Sulfopaludibacter sp. SbA4]
MPGSLAISTRILRNPSLGVGAGFREPINVPIPQNTGIGPQNTIAVIVNSVSIFGTPPLPGGQRRSPCSKWDRPPGHRR